jgi:catechol 2,3-dioxygenase
MTYTTHPETRIGHVHLKVSDLDRSIAFYRDVMGFDVQQRYGNQAAFLNTWESQGGTPPAPHHTGLYHVAFVYPDRPALARTLANVIRAGVEIDGAADHGVSEAIYFRDPDGNGIEIYRDRPRSDWPHDADGMLKMGNAPLDLRALLAEAA